MVTQLFLAGREENRLAGYDKYRLLPYAGQLMNLPINQVAAHLRSINPLLATKFLSALYDPEKDYDEKRFLTSCWETATSRLYPIMTDEILRCFNGSDFTAEGLLCGRTCQALFIAFLTSCNTGPCGRSNGSVSPDLCWWLRDPWSSLAPNDLLSVVTSRGSHTRSCMRSGRL